MPPFSAAESMHRLIKQALDSGSATSLEEAQAQFSRYRVCFLIGEEEAKRCDHQAALLTGISLAYRVFLGGVDIVGNLDVPLYVPLPLGNTLKDAVLRLGGQIKSEVDLTTPRIFIGGAVRPRAENFEIRAVFSGWRGGAVPTHINFADSEPFTIALAPMLAAAFAVSETFFHVQALTPSAGRRSVGLSLWNLGDWLTPDSGALPLQYLPSHLWLIGLGHLGQAYLWALGLLPYPTPSDTRLILQDIDVITPSTSSTSILTDPGMIGQKKARVMAKWAETRGFETVITERKFDRQCKRAEDEATIALCGLDNALGRQALEQAGFALVVEAGLGRGHRDFRTIRLHTLPGTRPASEIWKSPLQNDDLTNQAAYQKMLHDGDLDRCGLTLLAGKAVGAPFVGAVAACLAISEILRLLHGGIMHELIDLDLQSSDYCYFVPQSHDFSSLNPGFVNVAASN